MTQTGKKDSASNQIKTHSIKKALFPLLLEKDILFCLLAMPFWSKKPSLEDQVIDLRMSSKMLDNQSKRCLKESKVYEKRMRSVWIRNESKDQEIAKGNQDTAKIYADVFEFICVDRQSCVRLRNQAKQFMVMSCRVEAAALTMQQMYSMSSVKMSGVIESRFRMLWLRVFVP